MVVETKRILKTVDEVATPILGITRNRMYELIRKGYLPACLIVRLGRQIRINEVKLMEWIDGGGELVDDRGIGEPDRPRDGEQTRGRDK